MVKRQTVWLSTMMVLSLMLIGYYTINGNVKQVSVPSDGTPLDTGAVQTDSSAVPSSTTASGKKTTTSPTSATPATASAEYFAQLRLTHQKALSQMEDAEQSIINNSKSTSQEVAAAEQKYEDLQSLAAKEDTVREMLQGENFKNAAIVSDDGMTVTVAVEAATMTAEQAVQVMKTTADQLGVDMDHVVVKHYA